MSVASKKRLLVVEDTAVNRDLFQQLLEDDYEIVFAFDGMSALEMLVQSRFDGMLLDISIPVLDGLSVARAIRENEARSSTAPRLPILAVTAHAMRGDRERSLAAGCDDHITKPIDEAVLMAALKRFVGE